MVRISASRPRPTGAGAASRADKEPPIPKRKPPSQRPERKLDATAEAIAEARETKPSEKPALPRGNALANNKAFAGRDGGAGKRPSLGGPAPAPSTKRPKQPGS